MASDLQKQILEQKKEQELFEKQVAQQNQIAARNFENALNEYKQWILKNRRTNNSALQTKASKTEIHNLPVCHVTQCVTSLFKVYFAKTAKSDGFHNPENHEDITARVGQMLESLEKPMVEGYGRTMSLHKNTLKVFMIAELLILSEIHPSRTEILHAEAGEIEKAMPGSLREQASMGRADMLSTALDLFLESMKPDETIDYTFQAPNVELPMQCTIQSVFESVDLDGDGNFSGEESRELVRQLLSRPPLGVLMLDKVFEDPGNLWVKVPLARARLSLILPKVVFQMAKNCREISHQLWKMMDKDGDGEVVQAEFAELFPVAFTKVILDPLVLELTKLGRQLLEEPKLDLAKGTTASINKENEDPRLKNHRACMACSTKDQGCVTM